MMNNSVNYIKIYIWHKVDALTQISDEGRTSLR